MTSVAYCSSLQALQTNGQSTRPTLNRKTMETWVEIVNVVVGHICYTLDTVDSQSQV